MKSAVKNREAVRRWKKAHPEMNRAQKRRYNAGAKNRYRESHLRRKYGITSEQFADLLTSQEARCANPGCRTSDPGKQGWHVDHNHVTGNVRGILCGPCNRGIGQFKESQKRLIGAAEYLSKHVSLTLVKG